MGKGKCFQITLAALALAGCYTPTAEDRRIQWVVNAPVIADPEVAISPLDIAVIQVRPDKHSSRHFNCFTVTIRNRTEKDIEIDWNKTLFVDNGQTSGGVMFEGIRYSEANGHKPPDIVLAKQAFVKTIYPANRLVFYSHWTHDDLLKYEQDSGDFGVSLSLKSEGKEIRETLLVKLTRK